ncbi:MAG: nucleotidyltransferase family protein [Pseudomonadota bacterium]
MPVNGAMLWQVLADPQQLLGLDGRALSDLIRLAWQQALAPRLGTLAQEAGLLPELPQLAGRTLADLALEGRANARRLQFEIERIEAALRGAPYPVVLLKGGAYHAADYTFSRGRLASDVDILVPHSALDACEKTLIESGWEMEVKSAYAEGYYRQWMHELPPLRHAERGTLIDVHHTLVPLVGRLKPVPDALIDAAVETSYGSLLRPSFADMFVHAALHVFYDGDFHRCLRGFLDLRSLLESVPDHQDASIDQILERAALHDAHRPVADALAMLEKHAALRLTREQKNFVRRHGRFAGLDSVFIWLYEQRAFQTQPFRYDDPWLAKAALYARSHWITMPPLMLARHTAVRLYQSATARD